jgi:hypothetical protein
MNTQRAPGWHNGLGSWIAVAALAGPPALAQDNCQALLRHGIYDYTNQQSGLYSSSSFSSSFCDRLSTIRSSSSSMAAGGSYMGFGADASFSQQDLDALDQAMCSSDNGSSSLINKDALARKVLSSAGLDAYSKCVAAPGIKSNLTLRS